MKMKNASLASSPQALRGSHEADGCAITVGAGGIIASRKDSVATIGLLVDGDVVREAS